MSNGSELKSPGALALRAAGYLPLPRWWVTQDQLDLIAYMVRQNEPEITRIREEAHRKENSEWRKKAQIDLAWKHQKAGKGNT